MLRCRRRHHDWQKSQQRWALRSAGNLEQLGTIKEDERGDTFFLLHSMLLLEFSLHQAYDTAKQTHVCEVHSPVLLWLKRGGKVL